MVSQRSSTMGGRLIFPDPAPAFCHMEMQSVNLQTSTSPHQNWVHFHLGLCAPEL